MDSSQSLGKKYDVLTKCNKDIININGVNTLYSLPVAKYKKKWVSEFNGFKKT